MRAVRNSSHLLGRELPAPGTMYLVQGGVPGPGGGVYLVPGVCLVWGCTWSWGGVPCPRGGVPGPGGVYLVGGVPGPGGVYLVPGVYLVLGGVPGLRGCT